MNRRFATVCAALALAYPLTACKDSTTTPAAQAAGPRPSLATASDTGEGGGGPGNQSHFVSNGTSGFVSWFVSNSAAVTSDTGGGGGFTPGPLRVRPGGSGNNPHTFPFFFIRPRGALLSCTLMGGRRSIPSSDLSGGRQQLQL